MGKENFVHEASNNETDGPILFVIEIFIFVNIHSNCCENFDGFVNSILSNKFNIQALEKY